MSNCLIYQFGLGPNLWYGQLLAERLSALWDFREGGCQKGAEVYMKSSRLTSGDLNDLLVYVIESTYAYRFDLS